MSFKLSDSVSGGSGKWLSFFPVFLLAAPAASLVTWFFPHGIASGSGRAFFELRSISYLFHPEAVTLWVWKALVALELLLPAAAFWAWLKRSPRVAGTLRRILFWWMIAFFCSYAFSSFVLLREPVTLGDLLLVGWSGKAWMRAVVLVLAFLFRRKLR